jgi:ribosomal protein L11 methyltransferase
MRSKNSSDAFRRVAVHAANRTDAERLIAEAHAAGSVGMEEREGEDGVILSIYALDAKIDAVRDAIAAAVPGVRIEVTEEVPGVDWSEQWKAGWEAMPISPRLLIRPSFIPAALLPGQAELVIDPGRAFGTGVHPSTHLALEWIDELGLSLKRGARVLDVGTGTGVLAMAAATLSDADVIAFDLDPLATAAARANAIANGVDAAVQIFTGGLDALRIVEFELVIANLLPAEMMPQLAGIATRVRPGGHAVLSGFLVEESGSIERSLGSVGLRRSGERSRPDAHGNRWSSLLTIRKPAAASS